MSAELLSSIRCDECGRWTTDPEWCIHGRVSDPECRESGEGCHHCAREAVDE